MNLRRVLVPAFLVLAMALSFALTSQIAAIAADAPGEIHGHSDVFAGNGVAIAWGILRGASEDTTMIVLRVAADPAVYARLAADGVDPFTQGRKSIVPERPLAAQIDVRIPRSQFGDFPRTELRFFAASSLTGSAPRLVVYYLGVPDTTPELTTAANLEAHLTARMAGLIATRSKTQ